MALVAVGLFLVSANAFRELWVEGSSEVESAIVSGIGVVVVAVVVHGEVLEKVVQVLEKVARLQKPGIQ